MAILYFLNAIQDYSTAKHETIGVAASARNAAFLVCFAYPGRLYRAFVKNKRPLKNKYNYFGEYNYLIFI
jgi:hypothetical protein